MNLKTKKLCLKSKIMKKLISTTLLIAMLSASAFCQTEKRDSTFRRHFIGSSLLVLANFLPDPPSFYQLNYGYMLTKKDVIIIEAITWTYSEPLGTYPNSKELYPGKVRACGLGLGYQRFLWKNLFTTVEPTFFIQQFYDTDNKKIQKGFQLYLQFILGYRFEFFKKRLFVEPSFAIKYWPVNTNFPAPFAAIERGAPKYKCEPGLNFGVRF
jgi:hypothetical protein